MSQQDEQATSQLDSIEVFVPTLVKGQSETQPAKMNKAQGNSDLLSPTKRKFISRPLHQQRYTFIGHKEGIAQLVSKDLKIITIPEELLPVTIAKGTSLTLTIELDKMRDLELKQDLINQQRQFQNEQQT